MNNISASQIESLAQSLLSVAAIYDPKDAAIVKLLLDAGTKLNLMLNSIKHQSDTDSDAVWNIVRTDYADSLAAFNESAGQHTL